jgi:hypothetical protein
MPSRRLFPSQTFMQYAVAFAAIAVIMAILWAFSPWVAGLVYVAAIAVLTRWGGRHLGYFTLGEAILGTVVVWLTPHPSPTIGAAQRWLELSVLIFLGLLGIFAADRGKGTLRRATFLLYRLYALPDRLLHRPENLLIFSHMRSGSSLLSHLLFSHPDVCGYGENHSIYSEPADLDALTGKVMWVRRRLPGTLRERYVMDKILHNIHLDLPTLAPLLRGRVRVIFLVREPRASISSMIKTFGYEEWWARDYYVERLAFLARTAEALSGWDGKFRPVFVNYDQILHQTDAVFALIEDQLDFAQPLQQHYDVIPETGKATIGDTSANIRSGTIVRDRPAPKELAPETVALGEEAYRQCLETLTRCCRTLSPVTEPF